MWLTPINIMPEGPELKIACDSLNIVLKESIINDIKIHSGRYFPKERYPDNFENLLMLLPLKIKYIKVKGKLLYFILENDWIILNTFGMSGRWTTHVTKHCHIELCLNNNLSIWFCDTRRFGTIKILDDIKLLDKKLNSLGPDMLNSDINAEEFIRILRKYNHKNITKVLMNQSILSGIGNYIKSESLYKSGISPHNLIHEINKDRLIKLYHTIKDIMKNSYYSQCNKFNIGKDIERYTFKFEVYMREYDSNGYKIIREKTPDGRTSHWVKELQI